MGRGLGGNTPHPHVHSYPPKTYTILHHFPPKPTPHPAPIPLVRERQLSRMTACAHDRMTAYAHDRAHAHHAARARTPSPFWSMRAPARAYTRAHHATRAPRGAPAPRARARAVPQGRFHFSVFRSGMDFILPFLPVCWEPRYSSPRTEGHRPWPPRAWGVL